MTTDEVLSYGRCLRFRREPRVYFWSREKAGASPVHVSQRSPCAGHPEAKSFQTELSKVLLDFMETQRGLKQLKYRGIRLMNQQKLPRTLSFRSEKNFFVIDCLQPRSASSAEVSFSGAFRALLFTKKRPRRNLSSLCETLWRFLVFNASVFEFEYAQRLVFL